MINDNDELVWTIKDIDKNHLLNTREYFDMREKVVVQFVKEYKTLTSEQALTIFGFAPPSVFKVVDIDQHPVQLRLDKQAALGWLASKGIKIIQEHKNQLEPLMKKIDTEKQKRLKENKPVELLHQTLKGLTIDRSGNHPSVTLPKTGYKLDIFALYHVNRAMGGSDGWFKTFGHCWGVEIQDELRELLSPMF